MYNPNYLSVGDEPNWVTDPALEVAFDQFDATDQEWIGVDLGPGANAGTAEGLGYHIQFLLGVEHPGDNYRVATTAVLYGMAIIERGAFIEADIPALRGSKLAGFERGTVSVVARMRELAFRIVIKRGSDVVGHIDVTLEQTEKLRVKSYQWEDRRQRRPRSAR